MTLAHIALLAAVCCADGVLLLSAALQLPPKSLGADGHAMSTFRVIANSRP
jgi:hypothetical protein